MRTKASVAVALSLGVVACKEPPSWRARWQVDDFVPVGCVEADGSPELDSACECSGRGISDIRLVTRDGSGEPVDVRTRPCFPRGFLDPDALVAGPPLAPGRYAVEVRAVKRQRGSDPSAAQVTDEPVPALAHLEYTLVWGAEQLSWQWVEDDSTPDDPNDSRIESVPPADTSCTPDAKVAVECVEGAIACTCVELTIEDDETVDLFDLEIAAPPQCDNGVDDDRDGLVDGADPSCSAGDLESDEVGTAQVRLDVSFFDQNPRVECLDVDVHRLAASVYETADGTCAGKIGGALSTAELACTVGPVVFTASGKVGPGCLEVVATDAAGTALTAVEAFDQVMLAGGPGGVFESEIDFEAGDFLVPVSKRATISLGFAGGCAPEGPVASVAIEVRDAHGGPLPVPVADIDGAPLDGTERPCPSASIETEVLVWGGYTVAVGGSCVDDAGSIPLAPGDNIIDVPLDPACAP